MAVTEGNSGITTAVFTVGLSNPSSQTVTVVYQTPGITAFPPGDYVFDSGVLLLSGPTNATKSTRTLAA